MSSLNLGGGIQGREDIGRYVEVGNPSEKGGEVKNIPLDPSIHKPNLMIWRGRSNPEFKSSIILKL